MSDEHDRHDEPRDDAPADPPAPEKKATAKRGPAKVAKKAPAKAAKKAPAKTAKNATKATKGTPKKAAKNAPPPPPRAPAPPQPAVAEETPAVAAIVESPDDETGFGAVDETAAHARQVVDSAGDTLGAVISRVPGTASKIPLAVAIATALLAVLIIRRLLSGD
jgi:hypothetical protein